MEDLTLDTLAAQLLHPWAKPLFDMLDTLWHGKLQLHHRCGVWCLDIMEDGALFCTVGQGGTVGDCFADGIRQGWIELCELGAPL